MSKRHLLFALLYAVALSVTGCATYQPCSKTDWRVFPSFKERVLKSGKAQPGYWLEAPRPPPQTAAQLDRKLEKDSRTTRRQAATNMLACGGEGGINETSDAIDVLEIEVEAHRKHVGKLSKNKNYTRSVLESERKVALLATTLLLASMDRGGEFCSVPYVQKLIRHGAIFFPKWTERIILPKPAKWPLEPQHRRSVIESAMTQCPIETLDFILNHLAVRQRNAHAKLRKAAGSSAPQGKAKQSSLQVVDTIFDLDLDRDFRRGTGPLSPDEAINMPPHAIFRDPAGGTDLHVWVASQLTKKRTGLELQWHRLTGSELYRTNVESWIPGAVEGLLFGCYRNADSTWCENNLLSELDRLGTLSRSGKWLIATSPAGITRVSRDCSQTSDACIAAYPSDHTRSLILATLLGDEEIVRLVSGMPFVDAKTTCMGVGLPWWLDPHHTRTVRGVTRKFSQLQEYYAKSKIRHLRVKRKHNPSWSSGPSRGGWVVQMFRPANRGKTLTTLPVRKFLGFWRWTPYDGTHPMPVYAANLLDCGPVHFGQTAYEIAETVYGVGHAVTRILGQRERTPRTSVRNFVSHWPYQKLKKEVSEQFATSFEKWAKSRRKQRAHWRRVRRKFWQDESARARRKAASWRRAEAGAFRKFFAEQQAQLSQTATAPNYVRQQRSRSSSSRQGVVFSPYVNPPVRLLPGAFEAALRTKTKGKKRKYRRKKKKRRPGALAKTQSGSLTLNSTKPKRPGSLTLDSTKPQKPSCPRQQELIEGSFGRECVDRCVSYFPARKRIRDKYLPNHRNNHERRKSCDEFCRSHAVKKPACYSDCSSKFNYRKFEIHYYECTDFQVWNANQPVRCQQTKRQCRRPSRTKKGCSSPRCNSVEKR